MNNLAEEIQQYDERLMKEFETMEDIAEMLTNAIATANLKEMETPQEDQITNKKLMIWRLIRQDLKHSKIIKRKL